MVIKIIIRQLKIFAALLRQSPESFGTLAFQLRSVFYVLEFIQFIVRLLMVQENGI